MESINRKDLTYEQTSQQRNNVILRGNKANLKSENLFCYLIK